MACKHGFTYEKQVSLLAVHSCSLGYQALTRRDNNMKSMFGCSLASTVSMLFARLLAGHGVQIFLTWTAMTARSHLA